MYKHVYKLREGQRVADAVGDQPVLCDAFLIRSLLELGDVYIGAAYLKRSEKQRSSDVDELLLNVTEDLMRYTAKSVESIIADALNYDVFAHGIHDMYTKRRMRLSASLVARKQFWLAKKTTAAPTSKAKNATCNKWNSATGCSYTSCKYKHACAKCKSTEHNAVNCTVKKE